MLSSAAPGAAEVLPVPDALRHMRIPKEETQILRSPAGAVLGEQRFVARVDGDRFTFDIATRFTTGETWDEHGALDLGQGFRARRYEKTVRRGGRVVAEQRIDFPTGKVAWTVDGTRAERTLELPPDTYVGPMLAVVLADVSERSPADARFAAVVFRPEPVVVPLRAAATDEAPPGAGPGAAPVTTMQVRADLGPVKNALFASLIPTHYFWFTRGADPEFAGFAGTVSNGLDVVMTPQARRTATARVPTDAATR